MPTRRQGAPRRPPRRLAGTRGHGLALAGGAAASLGALFFVRAFPGWMGGGLSAVILFAATAALVAGVVLAVRLAVPPGALVGTVAAACAGALLTDGLLLAFAGGLYDAADAELRQAGAWLLFGTGAALGAAILFERRVLAE